LPRPMPDAPVMQTDFVLIGQAEARFDTLTHALLPRMHNPKRVLLQPVVLTSNNQGLSDFVLVGPPRDVPPADLNSVEAQAAWLRNHRRALNSKESTDFVLIGLAEPQSDDLRNSLLASVHNPRRALLEPVVLTSNHRGSCEFILVGNPRDEPPTLDSVEAQAAWLRNRRRALQELEATKGYKLALLPPAAKTIGRHGCAKPVEAPEAAHFARAPPCVKAGEPPRAGKVQERAERKSNDSVMSFLD